MAQCVNIYSKEFKELSRQTNLSTPVLKAKVGIWQSKNGYESFPSKDDIFSTMTLANRIGIYKNTLSYAQTIGIKKRVEYYNKYNPKVFVQFKQIGQADMYSWEIKELQPGSNQQSLFGIENVINTNLEFHINTLNVIGNFLENIGVERRLVPKFLSKKGSIIESAVAAANFMEGTIDIIEDIEKRPSAWNKLPEEAAHFWYRLLDNNSELKEALLQSALTTRKVSELTNTIYNEVYDNRTREVGRIPLDYKLTPLREEAIGQLIAEAIKRIETNNASAADYSFFKQFLAWINSITNIFKNTTQDPFEVAAMKILSSDMSDLLTWEEYSKLNNIVNFSDVLTQQSVAPIDYSIISDIGKVVTINERVGFTETGEDINSTKYIWSEKNKNISGGGMVLGKSSPLFDTKQEVDNWVFNNIKEYDQRQKHIIQEVLDNQMFFDRLLNKTTRKKSKYLPKTLKKYYTIVDSQNLKKLNSWNAAKELQQITQKLSEQEKEQIIQTNGYTNIAPTLKALPNLLQKYRKNPIVLSEPIKLDGAKKQELSIINGIKDMIKLENPGLKSISAEDFVGEAHNWLQTNYLLGFANENSYLSYRTDQTFKYLNDRKTNEDIDIANLTEEDIQRMPFEERQRMATIMGLSKENPDVYHNKVSLRFNDTYHNNYGQQANHFAKSPSAWGNLTYFYSGKNKWKDAVLLHEIQNDNIEALRNFKYENTDLESSLGRYLQSINEDLLDNIEQIQDGNKKIEKNWGADTTIDNQMPSILRYMLPQIAELPLEQGYNHLKERISEHIEIYRSDNSGDNNPEKVQEKIDLAYNEKRIMQDLKKRGGLITLLSKEDLEQLKYIINTLNTEQIYTGNIFLEEENQAEPGDLRFRNLKEKKQDFKAQIVSLEIKLNDNFQKLYGKKAPIVSLEAPAKPLPKSLRRGQVVGFGDNARTIGNASQELNENIKFLFTFSEKKTNDKIFKEIEQAKKKYIKARNATNSYNFNVKLSKITKEQYDKLVENYKFNRDLLEKLIKEDSRKALKEANNKEYIENTPLINQNFYEIIDKEDISGKTGITTDVHFGTWEFGYDTISKDDEYYYTSIGNGKVAKIKQSKLEEAIISSNKKEQMINVEKTKVEKLKQEALAKKEELEKEYGKVQEVVKQTLEIEMNYFTPLVHHLIQKHINQYGKDFPMYFSGYNITKLTQGNKRTAMIYAGKDEIKFTEREAKKIKFEAAIQIGLLRESGISEATDENIEIGIKKLNEYKRQSNENLDRVINTIMNLSGNQPIETGAIYNAMSQVSGVKLIWQDSIEGLIGEPGGYLVDLSNYDYNTPILYGLDSNQQRVENEIIDNTPNIVSENKQTSASPEAIKFIKDFLKRVGVDYVKVSNIVVNGTQQNANGVADILQNLIQVVDGKEAEALPEEAMHFAIEIIEQTDPALFNQLMKEVNDYALYNYVLANYSKNPLYQDAGGRPDIRKLKKEAIAKILSEVIIKKIDGVGSLEKTAQAEAWWQKILQAIRNLFVKSGFDNAAIKIMKGEDIGTVDNISPEASDSFLQVTPTKQSLMYDTIKNAKNLIEKKGDEGGYFFNGVKFQRVTDLVDAWYKRRFSDKSLTENEFDRAINDLKAEKGTDGHNEMENIFNMFVDENGYVRETPLNDDDYVSLLNPRNRSMYETLRDNMQDRLASFPEGTKFMSEAIIFDSKRKIAGTVDFLAITPDGKINILDWKFMDLNTDKFSDVPWYKVAAWEIQMTQYKTIISSMVGAKKEDFQQTRMIPIQAIYSKTDYKNQVLPRLLEIKIGDVNVKNIEEDFLLPVGITEEKTGNKRIDELVEKLNAVYKKLSEEKVIPSEKSNKAEQLNALYRAIRLLQIKQDIRPLLTQVKILNKQIDYLIEKYKKEFENVPKEQIPDDKISGFAGLLRINLEALEPYLDLNSQLKFLFKDATSDEDIELKFDLRETVEDVVDYKRTLQDLDREFGEKFNNADYNPEKVIKGITRWFSPAATLQVKNIQNLFVRANKAIGLSVIENKVEIGVLERLKENYTKWAASKGLTFKNQFNIIMKSGKNELIDEFKPEFYKELQKKINEKDYQWIKDNVDKRAYGEYLAKKKVEEIKRIKEKPRVNNSIINKLEEEQEIKRLDAYYDTTSTGAGWLRYNDIKKFPNRDTWESEEWKTLSRPENAPAKDLYDYIVQRNNVAKEIGYINAKEARAFLPWVRKGTTETMLFGGKMNLGEQTLRNISVDENDIGLGRINPLTNEPINSVPIYFTSEIEEGKYSTDLFRTMALYNEQVIRFKNLTAIEEQALQLLRAEKNKKSIQTSKFNKPIVKDGAIQYNENNIDNSRLLQDMITGIVYQQKYIENEAFDQALFKFKGYGKKINEKLGFGLFPEDLDGRQISVNKTISFLNNTFQLNTLGLNPLSAMSNLLGGTFQSYINAGKYFTKEDYFKTQMWVFGNKMGGKDKVKAFAALEYFVPFTDNYNKFAPKELSLNKVSDEAVQDFIMIMMRNADEAVQKMNFFTYLNNSIVIDGEIQNVREYLRSTSEYADFYEGSFEQRQSRTSKFEEDVIKLLEEKGVMQVSEVVDGKLTIPGINEKSDTVIEFRRKVQQLNSDALGNLSEENRRMINMNIYGTSIMVFKNWIPRLADVRFGNLKYNAASDAYEWGRSRMVFRMLSVDIIKSAKRLRNSLVANDKGVEYMRELFENKKADYLADTGRELEMTEAEFINLVRQNIRSQAIDLVFYVTLMAIYTGLKALAPDDDENAAVRNQHKFLMRASDKLADEIGYFYDFTAPFDLLSRGIVPTLGLIENYTKLVRNFMINNYALVIGDDELAEDTKVLKYLMKSFPIANQAAGILPLFAPEVAKDLGVQVQSKYQ